MAYRKRSKMQLIIMPFEESPAMEENFEEKIWTNLEEFLDNIFQNFSEEKKINAHYHKQLLYNSVEDLVLHEKSEWVLQKFQKKIYDIIGNKIKRLVAEVSSGANLLTSMEKLWTFYCDALDSTRQVFLPLDRCFVFNTDLLSIWNMGMGIFARHLSSTAKIEEEITKGLLLCIKEERENEKQNLKKTFYLDRISESSEPICASNNQTVQTLIHMFLHLNTYREKFEGAFIKESDEYYRKEGDELCECLDVSVYTQHIQDRLIQEEERTKNYLYESTEKKIMDVVRYNLIERHAKNICKNDNLLNLMNNNRIEELRRIYQLFSQIDLLNLFKDHFIDCVKIRGSEIMKNITSETKEQKRELIRGLLDYKERLDEILAKSFSKNEQISLRIKDSWEEFLNADKTTAKEAAHLLAKHCDVVLRNYLSEYSEEEANEVLLKVLIIFRYLNAKDFFEEFYRNDLSRRLLLKKSFSEELEKKIIFRLKDECGSQFTNKMEGMFKDVDVSKDILNKFYADKESSKALRECGVDFEISICAVGTWPLSSPKEKIIYPPSVESLQNLFETFYKKMHEGRSLIFLPHIGTCLLKANFRHSRPSGYAEEEEGKAYKRGVYDFVLSQIQGICLLLFNEHDSLSLKDIYEATRINMNDLHRQLLALVVNNKTRILLRKAYSEKPSELHESDLYTLNLSFSSHFMRLQISQIQLKETKEDIEKAEKHVYEDRTHQIDAAIVRVMKSEKKMKHNELMLQVAKYLKFFEVEFNEFKKRVESLLDREFIERDAADPQTYLYLA